jgi:hypothetical protein
MLLDRLFSIGRRRTVHVPTTTADLALEQARELCALNGPWAISAEYSMLPGLSLPEIAETFARTAYIGDDAVLAAAKAGAIAGFDEWLAGHPGPDPID